MKKHRPVFFLLLFSLMGCTLVSVAQTIPFSSTTKVNASVGKSAATLDKAGIVSVAPPPNPWKVSANGKLLDLSRDYEWFLALLRSVDQEVAEMEAIRLRVSANQPLSVTDEQQISHCFVSMLQIHSGFVKLAEKMETLKKTPRLAESQKEMLSKLSLGAFAEWYRLVYYLAVRPAKVTCLKKKMNEAVPEVGVPEWQLNGLIAELGDGDLRDNLFAGFDQFWQIATDDGTTGDFFPRRIKWDNDYIEKVAPNTLKVKIQSFFRKIGTCVSGCLSLTNMVR